MYTFINVMLHALPHLVYSLRSLLMRLLEGINSIASLNRRKVYVRFRNRLDVYHPEFN